jgi:septal ring factor EnvC (AmiA/AmiB activator)
MDAFKFPSPNLPENNSNPLLEIRSYLSANQQVVRSIETDLKETSVEVGMALAKISAIESSLAVLVNRIDRIDRDSEDAKSERRTMSQMVWSAFLAAVLAVVVPLVIRPGIVSAPSVGQVK